MSFDFKHKTILITGASSGIGRETAIAFAKAGANVVIASRRQEKNEATLAEVKKAGAKGLALKADVSKEAEIEQAVAAAVKEFERIDIAFNNAGIEEVPGPLDGKTGELFSQVFDINVKGVLLSMKHEIAAMLKTGGGSIINTSSALGHIAFAGVPIYTASKHAVEGLTKSVALEFAKQNIRVNAVAPAAIETDMLNRFANNEEARAQMGNMHPIGRVGQPREIAGAVLWLASDYASFVTGQSILVDGGFTAQ